MRARNLCATAGFFRVPVHSQTGGSRRPFLSTSRVFLFVLAVGLFSLATRDLADPDLWWHLRTGQLILETRAVPHTDPFSYAYSGQPWVTHEWLTEVMLYAVYSIAGKGALVCSFALIISAAFLINYRRCQGRPYAAGVLTLWGALSSVTTWGVRPQMISLLLTSLFLILLDRSGHKPRLLWWLPALMLLWVNLHGGYAVGIAVTAFYLSGSVLDVAFGRIPREHTLSRIWHLSVATLVCLMVVPANPSGLRLYWYPIQTLRLQALQRISEWRPPDFHVADFWLFFLMVLFTLIALGLSKRRMPSHQLLLVIATAAAGLHSVRHIPIFVLVAIPVLSQYVADLLLNRSWAQGFLFPRTNPSWRLAAANAVTLLTVLTFTALHVYGTVRQLDDSEARNFPDGAASFLATQHVPSPLLNHYDWGGYLIWRLYPNYQVWVDGRTDLYGDIFMDDFLRVYWAQAGWKQQLERAGIQSAILPPSSPLARSLVQTHSWQKIYEDRQAVILTRRPMPPPSCYYGPPFGPLSLLGDRRKNILIVCSVPSSVPKGVNLNAQSATALLAR